MFKILRKVRQKNFALGLTLQILLVLSPLLLLGSLVFFGFAGQNKRVKYVDEYNEAVKNWLLSGWNSFRSVTFSIRSLPSDPMLLPLMLEKRDSSFEAANTGAHIKFDNDMIPYTSAYSSYLGVTANKMPFNDVTVMDWERELIKLELRRHIGSSVITLWNVTIPLSFFHVEPAVNGRCSYGQYMDGACSLAFVLQSLCFVVDPENNFQLDTTRGEGCIVTDRFQRGADPLRTGATSASNGFLSSRHYYPYFPTNLPASWSWASKAMTIYVRSTKDPFVHALRMTQGTLDFGKSRQYYISIALCLIIASAFLFLIVFYSAKLYIARQKSRHQPDPTSSVVQNPLGVFRANIHDRNPEPSSEDPVNEVELSSRRVVWTRANGRN